MMPFENFRSMSDYNVESRVACLNTLEPVKNRMRPVEAPFAVCDLIRSSPGPVSYVASPERGKTAEYRAYMATIAVFLSCHTPSEKGHLVYDMRFGGGHEFGTPIATVVSANITADPKMGIGRWSEDCFVQRFVLQRVYPRNGSPKILPEQFTLMP
jgi:hypothetical protein